MRMVILVGALLGITSSVSAQAAKEKPPQVGTVRVAVVNVGAVFSGITRYAGPSQISERDPIYDTTRNAAKKLTDEMKAWQLALDKGDVDAESVDLYKAAIEKNRAEIEKLDVKMKEVIAKTQEKVLVKLWNEMKTAIKTYATAHDIELVIAFGDPEDKELLDQFPNVNRKMQSMDSGGALPLFFPRHVDLSQAIVDEVLRARSEKRAK